MRERPGVRGGRRCLSAREEIEQLTGLPLGLPQAPGAAALHPAL